MNHVDNYCRALEKRPMTSIINNPRSYIIMFWKIINIISKNIRSKVTDFAALKDVFWVLKRTVSLR